MRQLDENLVSIITPAFNSAKFIHDTINSVLSQTYPNWEMLIVVDAGTTDNTIEIVNSFIAKDSRIRLIHIPDKRGISLSRNTALSEAKGKYVAFLDSDDMWLPNKLEKHLSFMQKNGAAFSSTGYRRISEDGKMLGDFIGVNSEVTYEETLINNTISCPTIIVDQSKTGQIVMREGRHEDYVMVLDLLRRGFTCYGLNEDLSRYRFVHNSRSRKIYTSALARWEIYRNEEKLSILKSLKTMVGYVFFAVKKRLKF